MCGECGGERGGVCGGEYGGGSYTGWGTGEEVAKLSGAGGNVVWVRMDPYMYLRMWSTASLGGFGSEASVAAEGDPCGSESHIEVGCRKCRWRPRVL